MKYPVRKKCILRNVYIKELLLISNLIHNKKIINLFLSNVDKNTNVIDEDIVEYLYYNNNEFKKIFLDYRTDICTHIIYNSEKILILGSRSRALISEIEGLMYNLNFKSIYFEESNNVFKIKVDNKYILTLTKIFNLNKYSYIIHSIFDLDSKKINHIKIKLNFSDLMIFLKDRDETFHLNKEIIDMINY